MERVRNLKVLDYAIIAIVLVVLVVGGLIIFKLKKTSPDIVTKEGNIEFQVFFKNILVTGQENPFKVGEDSFITIRNVPYTKLKIKKADFDKKKIAIPANNKAKFVAVEDVSQPFQYDFLVTFEDKAKMTDDGAVIGGNKIKIGLPIILEGADYKFTGIVSEVKVLD